MRIATGSASVAELEAVREAWGVFSASIPGVSEEAADFLSYHVPSDAPEMPLTVDDLMQGALGRAENLILQLKREKTEADFYIGLQRGFNIVESQGPRRLAFFESWAYVSDGHKGFFGHGGGIAVPPSIADPVIDRGIGLGIVTDRFSGQRNIQNGQGLWGILTKEILTTKHSFVIALFSAFAPFYNQVAYS